MNAFCRLDQLWNNSVRMMVTYVLGRSSLSVKEHRCIQRHAYLKSPIR